MTTKTILAIAAFSLTGVTGVAQAGVSLGGTGEYGDIYAHANPGERISPVESGAGGRAAFGTPSRSSMSGTGEGLESGGAYLGGVGAYGDIYPLTNPGSRAR